MEDIPRKLADQRTEYSYLDNKTILLLRVDPHSGGYE